MNKCCDIERGFVFWLFLFFLKFISEKKKEKTREIDFKKEKNQAS